MENLGSSREAQSGVTDATPSPQSALAFLTSASYSFGRSLP